MLVTDQNLSQCHEEETKHVASIDVERPPHWQAVAEHQNQKVNDINPERKEGNKPVFQVQ